MNQMMGNMNQMGMNNQFMANFGMDETAMKLKAIIAPYEQKISELEEKIKQKDFEILLLKEKLNNYEKSQFNMNNQIPIMNPMNINMNMNLNNNQMLNLNQMNMNNNQILPMNSMNINWRDQYNIMNNNNLNFGANLNNQNMIPKNKEEKIQIKFLLDKGEFKEFCAPNEKNKNVIKRFCKKYGIKFKEHKFFFNGKKLLNDLTIAELGLCNDSRIIVINAVSSNKNSDYEDTDSDEEIYAIKFRNTNGKLNTIRGNPGNSIGTIIKKYLKKIGRPELINNKENIKKEMAFIYNAEEISIYSTKKLNNFFSHCKNPTITVNDTHSIIAV